MSTKRSKRYQEAAKLVTPNKNYSITEAVETMKSFPAPKFDPTVTVSFHLTVDPRKSDQMVRGSVSLPNGTGKNVRVLVFAQGDAAKDHIGILEADTVIHISGKSGEKNRRHLFGKLEADQVNRRRQTNVKHAGNILKRPHQQERDLQRMKHFQRHHFSGRRGER